MNITELLSFAINHKASDLHITTGKVPAIRVNGKILMTDFPELTTLEISQILSNLNRGKKCDFSLNFDQDFACSIEELGRFRVNWFRQHQGLSVAIRILARQIPLLSSFNLTTHFLQLCTASQGLILITGATGSGKSTSLAAIINHINNTQAKHIISIEDPVEFIFNNQQSLINQREVGKDTSSFKKALRAALREDPDIIVIGELRDLPSIRLALTAAETGHLVFATLHTSTAAKTINRIIDVFPQSNKDFIRYLLADSLTAVLAQKLIPINNQERRAAFEIMICNSAIRNLIRENKINQIYTAMQMGRSEGMSTFESENYPYCNAK